MAKKKDEVLENQVNENGEKIEAEHNTPEVADE
jgi:hypothetical protein